MTEGQIALLAIMILGIATHNNILSTSTAIILLLNFLRMDRAFSLVERRGVELGLIMLTVALLAPFGSGRVSLREVFSTLLSTTGLIAILGGIVGAILNSRGVNYLSVNPQIVAGVILGSILSVAFFGGIPVGPVMAAGITAVLLQIFSLR